MYKSYATMYFVQDMKKSIAFYKETVGLEPRFEDEGWTEFELGGHALALHPAGDKDVRPGDNRLILEVEDIEKVVGLLKEKRVEFVGGIQKVEECGFCADFKDPDGNLVGLYQHTQK